MNSRKRKIAKYVIARYVDLAKSMIETRTDELGRPMTTAEKRWLIRAALAHLFGHRANSRIIADAVLKEIIK